MKEERTKRMKTEGYDISNDYRYVKKGKKGEELEK